ncbi:MAG: DASS family sodium-coupled anion symporter [Nannocystaceae bacterium]
MTVAPKAALSPAEQRFDLARRSLGRLAAPIVFVATLAIPWPGLEMPARCVAAIAAMTIVLWVTEAIPLAVSALLAPSLAVVLGVTDAKNAFAPFAHPLIFLFLGGFFLAEGLVAQGFDRRAALWLMSRRLVAGSPARAAIIVCCIAFGLSMWISNTATMAMMIPIVIGLCATMERLCPASSRTQMRHHGEGLIITLAYSATLGGVCTPVGTAPNMIALGALEDRLGVHIDFLQWMSFAVPTSLVGLLAVLVVARRRFPSPVRQVSGLADYVRKEHGRLGPMSRGEVRSVVVFGLAIVGWITPAVFRLGLGTDHAVTIWARTGLKEGVVALLCSSLLFILPGRSDPQDTRSPGTPRMLSWQRAATIDWGTLLLLGGGLALGKLVFETGLATAIGQGVLSLTEGVGTGSTRDILVLVLSVALVIYMTEVTSNTATTSMMLPVLISVAVAGGSNPLPLVLVVTMAASYAFMLPVSTPPNAIAYGTGHIRISAMIRFGWILDLFGLLLLVAAGLWFLPALPVATL